MLSLSLSLSFALLFELIPFFFSAIISWFNAIFKINSSIASPWLLNGQLSIFLISRGVFFNFNLVNKFSTLNLDEKFDIEFELKFTLLAFLLVLFILIVKL